MTLDADGEITLLRRAASRSNLYPTIVSCKERGSKIKVHILPAFVRKFKVYPGTVGQCCDMTDYVKVTSKCDGKTLAVKCGKSLLQAKQWRGVGDR